MEDRFEVLVQVGSGEQEKLVPGAKLAVGSDRQ
jgi:hypothetical protein